MKKILLLFLLVSSIKLAFASELILITSVISEESFDVSSTIDDKAYKEDIILQTYLYYSTALFNANFNYDATGYCQNLANPVPTITGDPGGIFSSSSPGLIIDTATGEINLLSSTVGDYQVTYTVVGGSPETVTQDVSVYNAAPTTFTYNNSVYATSGATGFCQGSTYTDGGVPFITGVTGGTFTSTPAGLVLDASGSVDSVTSALGVYTVTYTTPGGCSVSTHTVEIFDTLNTNFSYPLSDYCSGGSSVEPIFEQPLEPEAAQQFIIGSNFGIDQQTGVLDISSATPSIDNTVQRLVVFSQCNGGSAVFTTTQVTILGSGGDPTFSYDTTSFCLSDPNPIPTISGTGGGTFSANNGLFLDPSTGEVDLGSSTTGVYDVTYDVCGGSSTVQITILDTSAGFNYAASEFCSDGTDPVPTITGTLGGLFSNSSNSGLVFIDTATGEIDLDASTAGVHEITYEVSDGGCTVSSTTIITISNTEDAGFNYGVPEYCQDGSDPTPTITGASGGVFSSTSGLVIDTSSGVIDVSASTIGSYVVTYTTSGTCNASSTQNISIAGADATFSYANTNYCADAVDPLAMVTGTPGGTFTNVPDTGLVFLDTNTGLIDLDASPSGSHIIFYTVTSGLCTASSSVSINIVALDNPSFNYDASSYCESDVDPTPTITGSGGGTFSSTSGLVINSGSGLIDLSASTVGTYTVTYTTSGVCPASSTQQVTIDTSGDASFTYSSTEYCSDESNPVPNITGDNGGVFSSTAGLVFVSAATGEINLSTSNKGVYNITYTVTNGACVVSEVFTVEIIGRDTANFFYPGGIPGPASFCQSDTTDPTPTILGNLGGTFTSTTGLVFVSAATGQIDLSASTSGTYTVTYTTAGTCNAIGTQTVVIDDADASFSYPKTEFCDDGTDPVATITGTSGGTFSSDAGVFFIDTNTGEFSLAGSAVGVHDITYTVSSGSCTVSSVVTIEILERDSASFNYDASAYCQFGADPTPVVRGTRGGTFSSTSGLVIDAGSGTIDLSASMPGTYTVTYSTSGPCSASETQTVTIDAADASFDYSETEYCSDASNPIPNITGDTGGTFSNNPDTGLVFISAATGEIDLLNSQKGTHDITYTVINGACTISEVFTVEVIGRDTATFFYPGGIAGPAPFCQFDTTDPSPTILGTPGGVFSSTSGLIFISTATGQIDLSASTAGTYTITYTTAGTCNAFSTRDVVIDTADASFGYASTQFCDDDTDPVAIITGTPGGTFSSDAGVFFVDTDTGEFSLAGSAVGSHDITYTVINGACTVSSIFTIEILERDSASFDYDASAYCQFGADPTPVVRGTTGGVFSSTSGLIINVSSGTIDLSASTPGTYTVTYATSGTCSDSGVQTVTIDTADASFIYDEISYCNDVVNPIPTITGNVGGTFTNSSGTGLVFVSAATGEIDLAGSTVGSHEVTYTVISGACTVTNVFNLDIVARDIATFNYTTAAFCLDTDSDPTPNITGTTGGVFGSTGGLSIDSATGAIDLSASTAGTYTVTYTTQGTCNASSTQEVTIDTADASFTYDTTEYCNDGSNPVTTITGDAGGVFSNNPDTGLVFVSTSTGEIDVAASAIGSHDITYTVTNASCTVSSIVTIDIVERAVADFNYDAIEYCQLDTDPVPTITGTTGGAFSSVTGLVIDSSTGTIDLSASTVGSYTVTYLVADPCGVSVQKNVTIKPANPTLSFESNVDGAGFIANPTAIADVNLGGALELRFAEIVNGTVSWSGPNGYNAIGTTVAISSNIQLIDAGTYTALVSFTDTSCGDATVSYDFTVNVIDTIVAIAPKVFLQGAMLNATDDYMRDDLRTLSYLPTTSPYADALTVSATLFADAADPKDNIVDWVYVELRDATDATVILDAQSALVQRDGDIVNTSGDPEIFMTSPTGGDYYIAIKHRNHLGIMSQSAITLIATPTIVDFTDGSTPTFGTDAQTVIGMPVGTIGMWAGDANSNGRIGYQGSFTEAISMRTKVLNDPSNFLNLPTFPSLGYANTDVNMDGTTKYSGSNPEQVYVRFNVYGNPLNFLNLPTVTINEQLP